MLIFEVPWRYQEESLGPVLYFWCISKGSDTISFRTPFGWLGFHWSRYAKQIYLCGKKRVRYISI